MSTIIYSEYTKYSYRENIFKKKTLFLKIKYYPARNESSNRYWYDDFNINSIRRLIDDHFLLGN